MRHSAKNTEMVREDNTIASCYDCDVIEKVELWQILMQHKFVFLMQHIFVLIQHKWEKKIQQKWKLVQHKMNSDATCTDFNIQHMNYHAKCVEIDM